MFKILKNRNLIPHIKYISYNRFWQNYIYNEYFDEENKDFINSVRECFSFLPEYVYEPYLHSFKDESSLSIIIKKISENFLDFDTLNQKVVVKKDMMEEWQAFISMCSAIPFVAKIYFNNKESFDNSKLINIYSILPISQVIDDKCIENLSNIVDLHIHINGTSESFYSWEKALSNPKQFIDSYTTKRNNSLEKLLLQDNVSIDEFFIMLELSKYVRGLIKYILKNNLKEINIEFNNFKESIYKNKHLISDDDINNKGYYNELIMWFEIFNIDEKYVTGEFKRLLHFYLLAQSQFERILIQQTKQNGFRQFLYISDNNIRDSYEDEGYKDRFRQLKHFNDGKRINLEIRITPKGFSKKFESIINAYNQLTTPTDSEIAEINKDNFKVSVVCHFIKLEEDAYYKKETYVNIERYAKTKAFTEKNMLQLLGEVTSLLNTTVELEYDFSKYFVGIDAAGNEMYAPPEAFAYYFRLFRNRLEEYNKKIGITFHAGEDFVHLISGIRYIYEVYEFLDYEPGDRVGHANALGLDSKVWRKKLNNRIRMKQGEWLDNLIFFAVKTKTTDDIVLKKIKELWENVYSDFSNFKIEEILEIGFLAYSFRKYRYVEIKNNEVVLKIDKDKKAKALKIYYMYLYETYNTYDKYIDVTLEEKFDQYISSLQKMILREMAHKDVIIESMISSNVRICFYDKYKQHHIRKWLDKKHNMPLITLASDDPGIFNNNIFVEYSHLYEMVDYDKDKFLEYVKVLQKNGEIARFK
ncbi:amidohydrolase family protein [Halarcobacter anaerophilus]|uniref:Adenosine deaminase domain-containing protein n=1 Tax=Halarcobacter anaerophilus TaxID=877500 RepID=A0A4V1LPH4_9BACT|nr:hypothetical protein [Halarcobacter anaerophilus]QDF30301.1 hypothetical protein AANAER_2859 [Halarcobacter anaerophilus]RXJ61208.1 hypothetical protein CRV06_14430 [Halarcobacter anaerophilus]